MNADAVAIFATGQSMSAEIAERLKGARRVVVNDAFRLAPDAEALCANDGAWWRAPHNADAKDFAGRKFSMVPVNGVERVAPFEGIGTESNSSLFALHVAIHVLGAREVTLYGVDLAGSHYFGAHRSPLKNTSERRFDAFRKQFERYAKRIPAGVRVLNASPISKLECFPRAA